MRGARRYFHVADLCEIVAGEMNVGVRTLAILEHGVKVEAGRAVCVSGTPLLYLGFLDDGAKLRIDFEHVCEVPVADLILTELHQLGGGLPAGIDHQAATP